MEIRWYGGITFEIRTDKKKILINYPSNQIPEVGSEPQILIDTNMGEDQGLTKHQDRINIVNPGEYEVRGVNIQILPVNNHNLAIIHTHEGSFAILDLDVVPSDEILKNCHDVNILMLSVGGNKLDAKAASQVSSKIEPSVLIPMGYQDLSEIEMFLKNENFDLSAVCDCYKSSSSDLDPEERQNILLKAQKL